MVKDEHGGNRHDSHEEIATGHVLQKLKVEHNTHSIVVQIAFSTTLPTRQEASLSLADSPWSQPAPIVLVNILLSHVPLI